MQSSSEQPLVGEERYVTTRITAAKETRYCETGPTIYSHLFLRYFKTLSVCLAGVELTTSSVITRCSTN